MSQIQLPQLMTIEEIRHFDQDGNCIWEDFDLPNVWHNEGQQFVLSVAFDTDGEFSVPVNYYVGLDDRTTTAVDDTLLDITDEPASNGYARQSISSTSGFVVSLSSTKMKAISSVINFSASGGPWGPVSQVFLATTSDNSGTLISTVELNGERTVTNGQTLSVRVNLSLGSCSS